MTTIQPDALAKLVSLSKITEQGPVTACTWDPMEKPHVRATLPPGSHCHSRHDLPRSEAEAELIAGLWNHRDELFLAARLAYPLAEALRNLIANPELAHIMDTHQARTALHSWELAQP